MPKKGKKNLGRPKKSAKRPLKKSFVKKSRVKKAHKADSKAADNIEDREKRFMLALEAAQLGVWEWNTSDNTIFWSENVHIIFGLTKEAFDGTFETYLNLILAEDKRRVLQKLQEAINNKSHCHFEHRIIWPDGTIHWIEGIGKVTGSKRNKTLKITGTIQDVSVKKVIEHEREDWKTRHELVSTSAGLVIYDYHIPSGTIIWSGNCWDVLGYKPRELGNIDRWIILIHPEDRKEAFALLETAQEELKPYDVFYRFRKKKGGYIHMHDRGFFIPDLEGKAIRMLGMMSDVSERVKSENTIRENASFRESMESTMPGILYVYDFKNKKLIYVNRTLEGFLGYTMTEIKTMGPSFLTTIIHPDDRPHLQQWDRESKGTVKEMEYRILTKDGQYRWLLARDTPFKHDEKGKVQQVIGIAQDITSRKEVRNQLTTSEQSYRELFDTVSEGIFIQDINGTILDVNTGGCLMYGYDKNELIGATPVLLAAKEKNDFQEISERIKLAFEDQPQSFEFWGKRKNGEIFMLEVRLTKGSYFGKQIIIATGRDITRRRMDEQALRESEQRFRTLQQASFGGIGLHDQGFIIDCNQGLSDITGYAYHELIGKNGLELVAAEWRPIVLEKIKAGYDKPYDVEGIRKDGSRYFLEIHGKNIPYQGRTIRVTEFRDITDRKHAEGKIMEQNAKLQTLTDDLVRKNNQLEEFTQIVSHNLRAPVGNITTLITFYEGAASETERSEYFNLLKESSATTLFMLNDVNDVLKIKQNKNIEKEVLKFEGVLQLVKAMLNARISQLEAEIQTDFQEQPSLLYPAIYLESILLNLLDNALKYSHPERIPKILFKTYKDRKGHIFLEVTDNGLGLNLTKYGHHVFKLRKTFHRHPESRGIGLFMIKNQIEAMGGEITMASNENEGSTFFVNFNKYESDAI